MQRRALAVIAFVLGAVFLFAGVAAVQRPPAPGSEITRKAVERIYGR